MQFVDVYVVMNKTKQNKQQQTKTRQTGMSYEQRVGFKASSDKIFCQN